MLKRGKAWAQVIKHFCMEMLFFSDILTATCISRVFQAVHPTTSLHLMSDCRNSQREPALFKVPLTQAKLAGGLSIQLPSRGLKVKRSGSGTMSSLYPWPLKDICKLPRKIASLLSMHL